MLSIGVGEIFADVSPHADADLRITGGDLLQTNGEPVLIGERVPSTFTAGSTSHGELLPAQSNRAVFQPEETP